MTSYGRTEEFLPAQSDWSTYAERLSYYFKVNCITNTNRTKAVLFSVYGRETFSILKDSSHPIAYETKLLTGYHGH